jgi:hypothetical protein
MTDATNISGAHVNVFADHAVKWAQSGTTVADRVNMQGAWLAANAPLHSFLPVVQKQMPGGYRMELLTELPDFVDDTVLAGVVINRLTRLWEEPTIHAFDPDAHLDYVVKLAARVDHAGEMAIWWDEVRPFIDDPCRVHGDPTIDNCMLRGGGELVITDPIPPGIHLPSIRALDIGKVIQSAAGYEEVARGRRPTTIPWIDDGWWEDVLPDVDEHEWRLCLYMAAVHFLRLLPYTPQHIDVWSDRIRTLIEHGT